MESFHPENEEIKIKSIMQIENARAIKEENDGQKNHKKEKINDNENIKDNNNENNNNIN